MENKIGMDVIVHKANVPTLKGEPLSEFTDKLNQAARNHVMKKLNATKGKGGAYSVEVYSDKIVMSFYSYETEDPNKYYAFTYKRQSDGTFDFGSLVEMVRVISYAPKTDVGVAKSAKKPKKEDMMDEEDESAKGCGDNTKKMLGAEPWSFDGWTESRKSFWVGVL
jgi:hypothetical protein